MSGEAPVRLADLLGALSLVTDLAAGVPMETSLRTSALAAYVARASGLPDADVADAYFTALLRHLGCTAFAHEAARLAAGDDHDFLQTFEGVDGADLAATGARAVGRLARHASTGARVASVARVLASPRTARDVALAHCSQASGLASDMAMGDGVLRALGQIYERFDGRGAPAGTSRDELAVAARALHVATTVEIHHRQGGRARALEALAKGRGTAFDPRFVDPFVGRARDDAGDTEPWSLLESPSIWDAYLRAEPAPVRTLAADAREPVARAFAAFADLKTPSKLGHSPAVAALATRAARLAGLDDDAVATLHLAALLHDVGVVGIPNGIWEKPGPLNVAEWERVRLHAYYTQRVLARIPSLGAASEIAGLHHERCDGSGYPSGAAADPTRKAARILAVADVFTALGEARPYRAAFTRDAAAGVLRDEAARGRLCASSVDAVLAAAGLAAPPDVRAVATPARLTPREIDVLVSLARGLTNKEIGVALGISAKTVQHHLAHVYEKVGVTTRASAALYAVRNGLVASG